MDPTVRNPPFTDVAIVGAGMSGISMAAHLKTLCPNLSFTLLERRANPGGTWDLFRYPGVRSDSSMHTLGFRFAPWRGEKAIAGGKAIRDYLAYVIHERGIAEHIRFGTTVTVAGWDAEQAVWTLTLEDEAGLGQLKARFLYLASGYYDYDQPHDARLPGIERFQRQVVHPQFWPETLDYTGKRVVIIGSGATAVTIVPAMADRAAHITMLQRTPTWMTAGPSTDRVANFLRRWLPAGFADWLVREKDIRLHSWFFDLARSRPGPVGGYLVRLLRKQLGPDYDPRHFRPPYGPWEQRLCLVPDGDLFDAIKRDEASIVTSAIEGFDPDGIRLASGGKLPADIIVTATGLKLAIGGKMAIRLDGERIDLAEAWFYRSCMFSNLSNFAVVFGYFSASWTLRADNTADYVCRVLNHMERAGAQVAVPHLPEDHDLEEDDILIFSSGYLQRARHLMPKSASILPWRLNQDYLEDCRDLRRRPVDDGVLRFERVVAGTREMA